MQYVKIKDVIVEQIGSGLLSPRQKLPSERKLSESFDTTRVTLREALSVLEAEGKIYREDRRGWFISPQPLCYSLSKVHSFESMSKEQGRTPATKVLKAHQVLATKQATQLLNLPPFANVVQVNRVRYLEQRPVAYTINFTRSEVAPNMIEHELTGSLVDICKQHFDVVFSNTQYRVSTTSLLGDVAQALRATSGSPAMLIQRLHHDQTNQVVSCDLEYWRHDALIIESVI
ncbi:UTRA domain-containing protein [Vibrio gallicus]|uniref:UTRA domain-containing protein n=1 Tax=Vibrio gallicus TaxID=190897 RepID=UPI0021C2BCAD|nr:UTRA domain-containing protein [Vibrio gallicus]